MEEEGKKKKVPKEEEPDPGPKLAAAGAAWILYPLTGGLHMDVKCRIICYSELGLALLFGILGACNMLVQEELANGFIQIVNGVFLLCLFILVFYGYRYRSPALLYLHTVQCVFVSLMIVVGVIFSFLLLDQNEVSGKMIRRSISDLHSTAICNALVLLALGLASWTRARDLIKIHRELPRHALGAVNRRLREKAGILAPES